MEMFAVAFLTGYVLTELLFTKNMKKYKISYSYEERFKNKISIQRYTKLERKERIYSEV